MRPALLPARVCLSPSGTVVKGEHNKSLGSSRGSWSQHCGSGSPAFAYCSSSYLSAISVARACVRVVTEGSWKTMPGLSLLCLLMRQLLPSFVYALTLSCLQRSSFTRLGAIAFSRTKKMTARYAAQTSHDSTSGLRPPGPFPSCWRGLVIPRRFLIGAFFPRSLLSPFRCLLTFHLHE